VNSGHTLFFRASTSCSKILNVKTIFNAVKIFRENSLFRASTSSSKILISIQWNVSGQTLFLRASVSCSKFWRIKNTLNTVNSGHTLFFRACKSWTNILNVKSILNTAKKFMTNSVFRASASSSKILKDKNISMQWKISGQLYFSGRGEVVQNFEWLKIYIFNAVNSGHTLFSGQATSCSKVLKDKKYFNTVKRFRATLFFRARKLFKNLNDKKSVTGRQGRQEWEFLP